MGSWEHRETVPTDGESVAHDYRRVERLTTCPTDWGWGTGTGHQGNGPQTVQSISLFPFGALSGAASRVHVQREGHCPQDCFSYLFSLLPTENASDNQVHLVICGMVMYRGCRGWYSKWHMPTHTHHRYRHMTCHPTKRKRTLSLSEIWTISAHSTAFTAM